MKYTILGTSKEYPDCPKEYPLWLVQTLLFIDSQRIWVEMWD